MLDFTVIMNSYTPPERATLPLPLDLHQRLKVAAAQYRQPMVRIAAAAIERELSRLERQRPRDPGQGR